MNMIKIVAVHQFFFGYDKKKSRSALLVVPQGRFWEDEPERILSLKGIHLLAPEKALDFSVC